MGASDEKLKPCPFCGEAPERVGELYCWCMNSGCIMYCFDITIELWNRRATPPGAVRGEVSALVPMTIDDDCLLVKVPDVDIFRVNQRVEIRPVEEKP